MRKYKNSEKKLFKKSFCKIFKIKNKKRRKNIRKRERAY